MDVADLLTGGIGSRGYFIKGQYYDASGQPSVYPQYIESIGPMPQAPPADVGAGERYACIFPASWYPPGDPCSKTEPGQVLTGPTNDPWYTPPATGSGWSQLTAGWSQLTANLSELGGKLKVAGYVVVGLAGLWLVVRGFEAYATIRSAAR